MDWFLVGSDEEWSAEAAIVYNCNFILLHRSCWSRKSLFYFLRTLYALFAFQLNAEWFQVSLEWSVFWKTAEDLALNMLGFLQALWTTWRQTQPKLCTCRKTKHFIWQYPGWNRNRNFPTDSSGISLCKLKKPIFFKYCSKILSKLIVRLFIIFLILMKCRRLFSGGGRVGGRNVIFCNLMSWKIRWKERQIQTQSNMCLHFTIPQLLILDRAYIFFLW